MHFHDVIPVFKQAFHISQWLSYVCCLGTADSAVNKPGIPGGLYGVSQGKWNQRSEPDEGNGLPGRPESAGNLWRGTVPLFQ